MALSWNEIKDRALRFTKEWSDTVNEEADAKPFLDAFFDVFGVPRKKIGTFEHRVKKLNEGDGYIDLLWKGTILIEMKSRGKNLDKAFQQAIDYTHGLKTHELPKYILVSDFHHFRLFDTEENSTYIFTIDEFVNHVTQFGFIAGYQKKIYKEQDPANIKAAELLGKFHDRLEEVGYVGHSLEVYLVRILFCLFAEDTTIFNKQQFQDFIEQRTNEDGSDLAARLHELFQVLNTPKEKRLRNLDEQLNDFPYVNGKLFEEYLPTASFDSQMRQSLLNCCYIDWSKISPAIFGSMFQSVMNPKERRNLGAHYTSEANILKVIKPLFLDDLWKEFESIKDNKNKLPGFHKKLSTLKFLDPACGCGNFLVITYRELRLLELEILHHQYKNQTATSIESIIWLDVDMMYGIEYEEFPARIAEVAMWLIDHQMNMLISNEFGQYFIRLPLKKAAQIHHCDSLETNWSELVSPQFLTYIIGNPPFIGSKIMSQKQRDQITSLFNMTQGSGVLDYVSGWYIKAAKYIQNSSIKVAFVSTNSIVQGEQTSILWGTLQNLNIKILFAHRTFKWTNEARGNAGVYCVIIGFGDTKSFNNNKMQPLTIFDYETPTSKAHELIVKNINPYLIDAPNILIGKRVKPLCDVPSISFGNMPLDGGNLLMNEQDYLELISLYPNAQKFFKRVYGSEEFLHNTVRWCLWLDKAEPSELKAMPLLLDRINKVKEFRASSKAPSTQKFSLTPSLFRDRRLPTTYIVVPKVSSERRKFIPLGFFTNEQIATDLLFIIPEANLYHFGILSSTMHMTWVRSVCGRLESRYRYSKDIVYNNFPWPEAPSKSKISLVERASQQVLEIRLKYPNSSLADLYDPLLMPVELIKAHETLDKAVDQNYRNQSFLSEGGRLEYLFGLYEKYSGTLFPTTSKKNQS